MSSSPLFRVDDRHVRSADESTHATTRGFLQGLDITVEQGELHAIMGSAGSGISTLGPTLMGSPALAVTSGTIDVRFGMELVDHVDQHGYDAFTSTVAV